jgi:hypothetical protein
MERYSIYHVTDSTVDVLLPFALDQFVSGVTALLSIIALVGAVFPFTLLVLLPIGVLYFIFQVEIFKM